MPNDEDFDADEILLDPDELSAEDTVETEAIEELHFDDEKIRGYEDVISDLDQISPDEENEIAQEENESSE